MFLTVAGHESEAHVAAKIGDEIKPAAIPDVTRGPIRRQVESRAKDLVAGQTSQRSGSDGLVRGLHWSRHGACRGDEDRGRMHSGIR